MEFKLYCVIAVLYGYLSALVNCRQESVTVCLEEYHNEANPRTVRLVCNQNEMIRVARAFMAMVHIPLDTADEWCNFPSHDPIHCMNYEEPFTDECKTVCNTISVCSLRQYHTVLPSCQATRDPHLARRTYIHIEYDCLPRYDPLDQMKQISFTHLSPQKTETATGSMLYVLSVDYPRSTISDNECVCIISMPRDTHGSIEFLDMDYTAGPGTTQCPVRVDIPGGYRCADSETSQYAGFSLSPAEHQLNLPYYDIHLTITRYSHADNMRLWLEVSAFDRAGYHASGMRVTCYDQQRQEPNIAPISSTTMTASPSLEPTTRLHTTSNTTGVAKQTPTSKMEDSTLYSKIGGSVAGVVVVALVSVTLVIYIRRKGCLSTRETQPITNSADTNSGEENIEPYTYIRAQFANGHVNEGLPDTYEHLSDREEDKRPADNGTPNYTQLPPKYENHNIVQNITRPDDNGYLNLV